MLQQRRAHLDRVACRQAGHCCGRAQRRRQRHHRRRACQQRCCSYCHSRLFHCLEGRLRVRNRVVTRWLAWPRQWLRLQRFTVQRSLSSSSHQPPTHRLLSIITNTCDGRSARLAWRLCHREECTSRVDAGGKHRASVRFLDTMSMYTSAVKTSHSELRGRSASRRTSTRRQGTSANLSLHSHSTHDSYV